ncbi:related to UTR1 (associated with ferric reductase activity) [Sporisorium reilianum SRZ2]|uniref:Related to UTR1 (Associated with ferric reductase activity) n=1 Tax=Sporisorium reilianum (strain SRZ2) TaxID=999809 RepID=E6ZKV9_SPORE|nr:related to UTR1 (associated with ferric reductase activity) [Sporisorium reilianum SRZ2]
MSASPNTSDQPSSNLPNTTPEPLRSIDSNRNSPAQPTLLNPGMATNPTSGLTLLEPPKPCSSKASSSNVFEDTTDSPASSMTDQPTGDAADTPINRTHAKVHDMSSLPHAHSADQSSASLNSPCFVHSYLDRGVALGESLKKQRRQLSRQRGHRPKNSRHYSQSDAASADDDASPQPHRLRAQPIPEDGRPISPSSRSNIGASSSASTAIPFDRPQSSTIEDYTSNSDAPSVNAGRHTERTSARVRIRTSSDDDDDGDDDDDHRDADHVAHQPLSDQSSSYGSSYSYSTDEEDSDKVRSLTRQLAETAVGVREMSKQLGRARVKSTIQSVMIITKARDNHLIKLTRELAIWLMTTPRNGKETGLIVYVDSQLRQSKRFDADGIRRDYPQLFDSRPPKRTPSMSSSFPSSAASATDSNGALNRGEGGNQLRFWNADMCSRSPHLFDFVVTLGGDGTVLFCSWLFQRIVPPVLPFALGSLGFLTNFDFKAYKDVMKSALDDGIRVNLRMRFTATVYRATLPSSSSADRHRRQAIKSGKTGEIILNSVKNCGWDAIESPDPDSSHQRRSDLRPDDEVVLPSMEKRSGKKGNSGKKCRDKEIMCFSTRPVETFEVLNDLVVDRGPSPYVSLLEVFGDEHHMTTAQADGLCISTPTGSTAYSLSAGGSLVHPEIPAILITPICPHTLSFRPMLLPDSMELRIAVPYNSRSTAWASFDGRGRVELKQGDHIKVTASRYPFPTVCAENQSTDWFSSISRTLKWNERQRQKSFVVVEEGADADSGNGGDKSKDASSTASPSKMFAKHGRPGDADSSDDDEDDSDDDDDDEGKGRDNDDEDAEKFDIDDTSTAVTRSNSPNMHSDGHAHMRRRSGQSTPRHANGGSRRNTGPSLLGSSLPRLTSITNTFGARSSEGQPNADASAAVTSNPSSLLNSPDRFGLQGPPLPPKAISERHLLSADFRLDGGRALSSSSSTGGGKNQSSSSSSDPRSPTTTEAGSGSTPRSPRTANSGRSRSTQSQPMTPSSALTRDKTPQGIRDAPRQDDSARQERFDRMSGSTGGTALVVYGEDESDSDSTTGAGQ